MRERRACTSIGNDDAPVLRTFVRGDAMLRDLQRYLARRQPVDIIYMDRRVPQYDPIRMAYWGSALNIVHV